MIVWQLRDVSQISWTDDLALGARLRRNSWDNASRSAEIWFNSVTNFCICEISSTRPPAGGVRCSEASIRSASNRCSPSLNSCFHLTRSFCAFCNTWSVLDNLFLALSTNSAQTSKCTPTQAKIASSCVFLKAAPSILASGLLSFPNASAAVCRRTTRSWTI